MKYIFLIASFFLCNMHPTHTMEIPPSVRAKNGDFPLHDAVRNGYEETIELLFANRNVIINSQNYAGDTPLHLACATNRLDIIKLLLSYGADITITNNNQATPLLWLFFHHGRIAIEKFIEREPDVAKLCIQTMDDYKNTQIHLCTTAQPIMKDFFEQRSMHNKLLPSSFEKYIASLIKNGVDIHAKNKAGKTALDLSSDAYNELYDDYTADPLPYRKEALNHQECIMHSFLRRTSRTIECALFKKFLYKKTDSIVLPKHIISTIMRNYYQLNIETIVAKAYDIQWKYDQQTIKHKNKIKKRLHDTPKHPELLWRKPIAKPILVD